MRDQLLALLEDGPKRAMQLSTWLGVSFSDVRRELKAMLVDGLVRRIDDQWALATYERPRARRRREATAPVNIEPPARAAGPITHISDGVEFEVVNDCSGPVTADWPGNAGESVFSGRGFKVSK